MLLGSSSGYQIAHVGNQILFVHRRTHGPAIVAAVAGGLAFLLCFPAVFLTLAGHPLAIMILAPLAVVCAVGASKAYRVYRERKQAPLEAHVEWRADLAAGELRTRDGQRVCALADLTIKTPMNAGNSMQGFMRWVVLRWPGGKATVYTAASSDAERVATTLAGLGVGRRD